MRMVFQLFDGQWLPKLPAPGREPDGETYFSIEQAAARSGRTEAELQSLWHSQWKEFLDEAPPEGDAINSRVHSGVLHRLFFSHLNAEQFADLEAFAKAHELSLWHRHLWAELRAGPGGLPKLEIMTTLDGLRWRAERTGRYAGTMGPLWCGPEGDWIDRWAREEPPVAAKCAVLKTGFVEPCWQTAHWEMYAPYAPGDLGDRVLPDLWAKGGPFMLAKCAKALAFRDAFPELANLYTPDEMAQARTPRQPRRPWEPAGRSEEARTAPAGSQAEPAASDEPPPDTRRQLELRMIDMGFRTPDQRRAALSRFISIWPGLYRDEEAEFCRRAWRLLSADPAKYGAESPALAT